MSVRFAAARSTARSPVARALARLEPPAPANDCAPPAADPTLEAALRHFAAHGIGAVGAALQEADRADEAGDPASRAHWLAVCRMFDKRAAAAPRSESR